MWLLLAFVAVPLIEIALFIQIGGAIGLWPTLGIVVFTAFFGSWLIRNQGALAMNQLRQSFSELDDPTEPLAHGAMIVLSGALLLTPGFFTDGFGFALLIPQVRAAVFKFFKSRVHVQGFQMGQAPRGPHPQHDGDVIDGEFSEVDPTAKPTHTSSKLTKH